MVGPRVRFQTGSGAIHRSNELDCCLEIVSNASFSLDTSFVREANIGYIASFCSSFSVITVDDLLKM